MREAPVDPQIAELRAALHRERALREQAEHRVEALQRAQAAVWRALHTPRKVDNDSEKGAR